MIVPVELKHVMNHIAQMVIHASKWRTNVWNHFVLIDVSIVDKGLVVCWAYARMTRFKFWAVALAAWAAAAKLRIRKSRVSAIHPNHQIFSMIWVRVYKATQRCTLLRNSAAPNKLVKNWCFLLNSVYFHSMQVTNFG